MATKVLLNFANTPGNRWLLSGIQYHRPILIPQTAPRNVRCFKKITDVSREGKTPLVNLNVGTGSVQRKILWKAFGFSVMFSGVSMVGAMIWEYEKFRTHVTKLFSQSQLTRVSRTGWRADVHNWWHKLDEGKKIFVPICCINVLVFCGWRIPALKHIMVRYFTANPASSAVCWPMVLSTFSHYSLLHLAANMYVLNSFSLPIAATLGKEQFLALYMTSGVMSSFASYFYKTVFSMPGASLGASGAIMGLIGFACTQYPDMHLSILAIPTLTFTAGSAIKVMIGVDMIGCAMGWRFLDHAAHLGGAACGIFWQKWGNVHIWKERKPVLAYWHKFRGEPPSK